MNVINNLFFELIQVAIGTRIYLSHTPSADEWGELYKMAKKQSLVGVCFVGVQRLPEDERPSEMLYLTWLGMAAKISQNFDNMRALEQKLDVLFKERGVKALVVKGASVAAYYDEPKLRQFGDIDIYSPQDYEAINGILKQIATEYNEDYYRHSEAQVDNVMVENHKFLTDVRGQNRWQTLEKYLTSLTSAKLGMEGCDGIIYPDDMLTLLFFVYHAQAHFLFDKISLKFLVDWYVLLHKRNIDDDIFVQALQKFELLRFAAVLTNICVKRLDLMQESVPEKLRLVSSDLDDIEVARFEEDIFCYDHNGFSSNSIKDRIARAKEFYRNRWKLKSYLGVSATGFVLEKFCSICKNKFNNKY